MGNFKEDIARVKAFVLDVDGVMTDGGIMVLPDGDFARKFNIKDGFAISYAKKKGYVFAIITGGRGKCLELRIEMLGIEHSYVSCLDKLGALNNFLSVTGLAPDEVMYMGDDIPDVDPMMNIGVPVCPADACPEVLNAARYISAYKGGEGCVRDVVEQVLRARGDWFVYGDKPHVPSR